MMADEVSNLILNWVNMLDVMLSNTRLMYLKLVVWTLANFGSVSAIYLEPWCFWNVVTETVFLLR
jgi:hypothetical protein